MNDKRLAIIDNNGIMDEGKEQEMIDLWNNKEEMDERDFVGRVLLVEIISEQ